MYYSKLKRIVLVFSAFAFLGLAGCGVWDNLTTYFNLYYNTSLLFENAEEQILKQKRELFTIEPINVPGNINTELVKVVEKCSKILQYHSETGYFEDALYIIGKSFFYQKNYQKSQRKFLELLAVDPNSDYALESELWIGRNQMKLKNYSEGLTTLNAVRTKAIEEGEDDIIKISFIEEISYRVSIEEYTGAIELANALIEETDDNTIKAEVYYEIGNLNMKIEDIENA
ncbi:MAG TPA: tetratricopeptide repeat protein, partial [Ignavibacteriaceae bacterium]